VSRGQRLLPPLMGGTSLGAWAGVLSRCDPRAAGPRHALQRRPLRRPRVRARAGIAADTGCGAAESSLECDADPRTHCLTRRRARRGSFLRSGTVDRRATVTVRGLRSVPERPVAVPPAGEDSRRGASLVSAEAALSSRGRTAAAGYASSKGHADVGIAWVVASASEVRRLGSVEDNLPQPRRNTDFTSAPQNALEPYDGNDGPPRPSGCD
jgi:hypothetical protein